MTHTAKTGQIKPSQPPYLNGVLRLLTALSVGVVLSACASVGSDEKDQVPAYVLTESFPEPSLDQIISTARRDIFKSGDIAEVRIYNVEELSGVYVVDRGGDVVMPLVGRVKFAGKSTLEVQAELVELYGENFLQNPSVNVTRESAILGQIVVDGAVGKPGVFEVDKIIQLPEAIALAEGLSREADPTSIRIIRDVEGQRRVKLASLEEIRLGSAGTDTIIPGDIIFVPDDKGTILFDNFVRTIPLLSTVAIVATRP